MFLPRARAKRPGNVMVEFAFVALVLYLLVAGTLEFGRAIYCAEVLQHATDLCARELSRTPLPAEMKFSDALNTDTLPNGRPNPVPTTVYDKHKLVILWSDVRATAGGDLDVYFARLPLVNQQLRTLMVNDSIDGGVAVLRYPGEVRKDGASAEFPYFVVVPLVTARGANGVETIEYVDVVEEIKDRSLPTSNPDSQPFSIASPTYRGVVGLRMNYPYQAATLSGFAPNSTHPILAEDAAVTASDPNGVLGSSSLVTSDSAFGPNAGKFGLGEQAALGQQVRPFRKVLTGQAIYRREVFQ